tara:strand:- start:30320 stop:30910 length:591 start_codon:yes stop_codon:yes gene_type:complete
MISLQNTTYNEERDGIVPIVAGVYPAHVSGLEAKDLETKAGEQTVFNVTFLVADEVAETSVPKMVKNGDGELHQGKNENGTPAEISGAFMKGKRFSSTGIWLTPNPPEGQNWKNRKYKEFFEHLGVVFPVDKDGNTQLAIVEEEDVIGHPCFIKISKEEYVKDGEARFVWKVFDAFHWSDGVTLKPDEVAVDDLPF